MTLVEKIEDYIELQRQQDELKAKLDSAKEDIINEMEVQGLEKLEVDNYVAQVSNKVTIKYPDEVALIKYLKENGYGRYVVEKVDTTPLNKELKKGGTLTESLHPFYNETKSKVLTVK